MLWERVGGGGGVEGCHTCMSLIQHNKAIENNSLYTQLEEK